MSNAYEKRMKAIRDATPSVAPTGSMTPRTQAGQALLEYLVAGHAQAGQVDPDALIEIERRTILAIEEEAGGQGVEIGALAEYREKQNATPPSATPSAVKRGLRMPHPFDHDTRYGNPRCKCGLAQSNFIHNPNPESRTPPNAAPSDAVDPYFGEPIFACCGQPTKEGHTVDCVWREVARSEHWVERMPNGKPLANEAFPEDAALSALRSEVVGLKRAIEWCCPDCEGAGYTVSANPLPSGEPGEPFQVQCFHPRLPDQARALLTEADK